MKTLVQTTTKEKGVEWATYATRSQYGRPFIRLTVCDARHGYALTQENLPATYSAGCVRHWVLSRFAK